MKKRRNLTTKDENHERDVVHGKKMMVGNGAQDP